MIWLASFPRSGNTYFRNILFEVYGIESSTYHHEKDYPVEANYRDYPVVKTHLLPHQLEPLDPSIPAVYLVRDGRDATISLAHHRSDLVAPGSDLIENVDLSIRAAAGSFFGGWSENVRQWITRASIVIRYEDLLEDPIGQVERLRAIMDLPEPNPEKLPTFQQLKSGEAEYGAKQKVSEDNKEIEHYASKNFRKGRSGSWREELPEEQQTMFWHHHGETMELLGYTYDGELDRSAPAKYPELAGKFGVQASVSMPRTPTKFLVEGSKLSDPYRDGIQRYLVELLRAMQGTVQWFSSHISIDVAVEGDIFSLDKALEAFDARPDGVSGKTWFFKLKHGIKQVAQIVLGEALFDSFWLWLKVRIKPKPTLSNAENSDAHSRNYAAIHIPLPQNAPHLADFDAPRICTIHDLTDHLYPEFHTRANIVAAQKGMELLCADNRTKYIAISDSTLRDFQTVYPDITVDRKVRIGESIDRHHFAPTYHDERSRWIRKELKVGDSPYFLTLSTLEPRKNLERVLKAFQILKESGDYPDLKLVCAGNRGWIKRSEYRSLTQIPDVIFPGFINEGWLPDAYSNALGVCYVSLYEGFGLPILEALSCGTPVLCGDNSSQTEVGGEVALYADATDVQSISRGMRELYELGNNPDTRYRAMKQSWSFSWQRVAYETLQTYLKSVE